MKQDIPYFNKVKVLNYFTSGLKLYSNGIPLRFDTYSGACKNHCSYCYSSQVANGALARMNIKYNPHIMKLGNIHGVLDRCERIFDNNEMDSNSYQDYWVARRGLIENGTMSDPFGYHEEQFHNTSNFMNICSKYGIPVYFNTKCNELYSNRKLFDELCELNTKSGALADVSLISINDKLLKKFEPGTIEASKRFKIVEELADNKVSTIISARPIIKGVTDVNYKEYIEKCCRSGADSIHLRTLIISGKQMAIPFWKKYAEENGMICKNVSYRYPLPYFMKLFNKAKDIAEDYGVTVTASHTLFFEFGTANKCDYSKTTKNIQASLFHPMLTDLLGDCYKHIERPVLLTYDNTMKRSLKTAPKSFINGEFKMDAYTSTLIWSSSCMSKIRVPFLMKGKDIIVNAIWDGFSSGFCRKKKLKTGYISTVNGIYTVIDKDETIPLLDENEHIQYAYIPEKLKKSGAESTHTHKSLTVSVKELKEIGIWNA